MILQWVFHSTKNLNEKLANGVISQEEYDEVLELGIKVLEK